MRASNPPKDNPARAIKTVRLIVRQEGRTNVSLTPAQNSSDCWAAHASSTHN